MKKLLLTAILAGSAFTAQAQDITFAMEPSYPPFENTNEKGEIVGFDVDIAKAICTQIQANCKFESLSFDTLIQAVRSKRIDAAISAIDITEARAKQVSFSEPYYDSSASFVAVKDKVTLETAKNVGVQNGTTFQQYVVAEAKQYNPRPYSSLQNAVLDLKNGRIDIIFGDTAVLAEWVKSDDSLAFVGDKVTNQKYFGNGLGIAVNKGNQALLQQLNQGLATIKENGEYQQIYNKWMSGE